MLSSLFVCKEKNQKVCIIGLGKSGYSAAKYLKSEGFNVIVLESQQKDIFEKNNQEIIRSCADMSIEINFGVSANEAFKVDNVGYVLLSPGILPSSALVKSFQSVFTASEFELSLCLSDAQAVLVTGSNGKSTTVSLLSHVLSYANVPNILCGNIGTPIFDELHEIKTHHPVLVVEASSYQLETLQSFKAHIGVFLNLSLNHLERHGTMEKYFAAKCMMFERMEAGSKAVIDIDTEWGRKAFEKYKEKLSITTVSTTSFENSSHVVVSSGHIQFQGESISINESSLLGDHNHKNMAVVAAVSSLLGVTSLQIEESFKTFKALPHRLERLSSEKIIFNDSKSTTPLSSVSAVEAVKKSFPDKKIILMLGGKAKPGGFLDLKKVIDSSPSIQKVVFFGGSREEISSEIRFKNHTIFASLKEAVLSTIGELLQDEILLFSPGCASFDEFNNFEHRGDCFKDWVMGQ